MTACVRSTFGSYGLPYLPAPECYKPADLITYACDPSGQRSQSDLELQCCDRRDLPESDTRPDSAWVSGKQLMWKSARGSGCLNSLGIARRVSVSLTMEAIARRRAAGNIYARGPVPARIYVDFGHAEWK